MTTFLFDNFSFTCSTRDTRSGFAHECTMRNLTTNQTFSTKINYYNRTWESYQYKSVMFQCVNEYREYVIDTLKRKYREEHNVKRITDKMLKEIVKNSNILSQLENTKNRIYQRG